MNAVTILLATTFAVLSPGDAGGPNTLRWAIEQVNAAPATMATRATIEVETKMTVAPSRPLPAITQPVILDFAKLTLDGTKAGKSDGLVIAADDVMVTGVRISNFSGSGIVLAGNRDEVWHSVVTANRTGIVIEGASDGAFDVAVDTNRGDGIHVTETGIGAVLGHEDWFCPECPYIAMKDTISGNRGNGVTTEGQWTWIDSAIVERNVGDGIHVRAGGTTIVNASVNLNGGNGITTTEPLVRFEQTLGACNGRLFLDERGDGPTSNDTPDLDAVVNAPHLDLAIDDLTAVTVAGTLDAAPSASYQLDFVALSSACEAAPVGTTYVWTDNRGFASFHNTFGKSGALFERPVESVAVIASRLGLDKPQPFATSELSIPLTAVANRDHRADLSVSVTSPQTSAKWGDRVPFDVLVTNHGPAAVSFKLSVPHVAGAVYDQGSMRGCWLDGIGFCDIGPLASGESATVRNIVTMPKGDAVFTYRAEVGMYRGSPDGEIDPSNDSAVCRIDLQQPHPRSAKH